MGQGSETLEGMSNEGSCNIDQMVEDYNNVKSIAISNLVFCPVCYKRFQKKTKGHVFCSNKGRNNCKDSFWNMTVETRRKRAIIKR